MNWFTRRRGDAEGFSRRDRKGRRDAPFAAKPRFFPALMTEPSARRSVFASSAVFARTRIFSASPRLRVNPIYFEQPA